MSAFSPLQRAFPLINVLCAIRDAIYFGWNWIISHYSNLRIVFLISLTLASLRAAVGLFGTLFNMLQNMIATGESVAGQVTNVSSQSSIFDKVNAIFPVAETFAFMVGYGTVLVVTTVYMLVRSAYKALPGKAT